MKPAWLIALVLIGCAGHRTPAPNPGAAVDYSRVMRLAGRTGIGHACPVETEIFTAAHLVQPFWPRSEDWAPYDWSDLAGRRGTVSPMTAFQSRDLARLKVEEGDRPAPYKRAERELVPGDELSWLQFEHERRGHAYESVEKTAAYQRSFAAQLILDMAPDEGASGTCVFNTAGEVVGIVTWTGRTRAEAVGFVVSIIGPWWPR